MTDNQHKHDEPAFEIRLDARAEHLMLVRQALEGALLPLGAGPALVNDVKLAVTEACSNIVRYAYNGAGGPMKVSLFVADPVLRIVVRDFGRWREREDRPADEISGMGIPLIKSVATSEAIAHRDDGTEVSMEFTLERVAGKVPSDD